MERRLNMASAFPEAYKKVGELDQIISNSSLDTTLQELIKIRASQINGCAYCIDLHTKDARKKGETEQRIYAISVWKESNFFTEKEKAVLALTEAVTLISEDQVPDSIYKNVESHFSKEEVSEILMAIIVINSFNRIAISTKLLPKKD